MRNLKKVLALVLALAMAFSFVASAATFPDVEPNTTTGKAVDLLTGLGVIGGYPDGTFGPDKTITRAEYLKMLFIMLNGKDDTGLFAGNSDKFGDVTGDKWFAPYVNWAVQLGIVGGYPDGTFKPDNDVTVAEATKMYVTALGFDALDYSFPYGFIDKGIQLGLFEDVESVGANDPAKRGAVAIMGYNMLFVTNAPRYGTYDQTNGWTYVTPIEKVFGAKKVETELVATSTNMPALANLTKEGRVALKDVASVGGSTGVTSGTDGLEFTGVDDLVGHKVEVWFTKEKNASGATLGANKGDKILAISDIADESLVVAASALQTSSAGSGAIKDGDAYATIDGVDTMLFAAVRDLNGSKKTYVDATDGTTITARYFWDAGNVDTTLKNDDHKNWVLNGGTTDPAFTVAPKSYSQSKVVFNSSIAGSYTFVDNVADETDRTKEPWDHVFVNYWRTGEVKNVTSANITINGINNSGAIPAAQLKGDWATLEKGDFANVSVTTGIVNGEVKNIYTVEKAEVLKGVTVSGKTNRGIEVDGTSYLYSYFNAYGTPAYVESNIHSAVMPGEKYDIVLDKGGNVYSIEGAEESLPTLMLVENVNQEPNMTSNKYTIKGLLSDGTEKTYELDNKEFKGKTVAIGGTTIFDWGVTTGWTNDQGAVVEEDNIAAIGKLIAFKTNADGQITSITDPERDVTGSDAAGTVYKYDASTKYIYKKANSTAAPKMFKKVADNTVFFNYDPKDAKTYDDDVFTVITGAEMNSFDNTPVELLSVKENDENTAEAVMIKGATGAVVGSDNAKMAYAAYDQGYEWTDDNMMVLKIKLLVDGKNEWFYSVPVDVKAANGDYNAAVALVRKQLFPNPALAGGNVGATQAKAIYVSFTEDGKIEQIYGSSTAGTLQTIENPQANKTNVDMYSTSYRGAVLAADENSITFGKTTRNGRAHVAVGPFLTKNSDGNVVATTNYSYEVKAIFPIAEGLEINIVNGSISGFASSTVTKGTVSDLLFSSDLGYSYAADFVLKHRNNNPTEPLEITQMTFFKYATGNIVENIVAEGDAAYLDTVLGQSAVGVKTYDAAAPDFTAPSNKTNLTVGDVTAKYGATITKVGTINTTTGKLDDSDTTLPSDTRKLMGAVLKTANGTEVTMQFYVTREKEVDASGITKVTVEATPEQIKAGLPIDLTDAIGEFVTDDKYTDTKGIIVKDENKLVSVKDDDTNKADVNVARRPSPNDKQITVIAADENKLPTDGDVYEVTVTFCQNPADPSVGTADVTVTVTVKNA